MYRVSGIPILYSERVGRVREWERKRVYAFKRIYIIYKRVSPPPHVSDVFICVINKTFFYTLPSYGFFIFIFYTIFFLVTAAAAAVSCPRPLVHVWVCII